MNVFVIPSWYPSPRHGLLTGSFVEDAVHALVRHEPGLRVDVALWGQGSHELSSARLRAWLAGAGTRAPRRPARAEVAPGLIERFRPVLTWRHAWARGNADRVLAVVRAQLAAAVAEHGAVHVLHAHVAFPGGWIAQRLARETGIPYVITEHMGPFPFAHFERAGHVHADVAEPLRNAARVIAVSQRLARTLHERLGVAAVVIPNGVDERAFQVAAHPARREGFTFLTVAALEPVKGVDVLLRSIHALGPLPGVRFRIVGAGTQASACRALALELGLGDRVQWLGARSRAEVREEMRGCDALVLTSRHESFGVVLAEAQACGKPVVATRCGGPEEIVDESNGVLVPVADVPATAAALRALASGERRFEAAVIRAGFEARFASRVVAARTVALYRDVAGVR